MGPDYLIKHRLTTQTVMRVNQGESSRIASGHELRVLFTLAHAPTAVLAKQIVVDLHKLLYRAGPTRPLRSASMTAFFTQGSRQQYGRCSTAKRSTRLVCGRARWVINSMWFYLAPRLQAAAQDFSLVLSTWRWWVHPSGRMGGSTQQRTVATA
jgi:hypothetical protein